MNLPSLIILLLVIGAVVLAIRVLRRADGPGCGCSSCKENCPACAKQENHPRSK